MGSLGKLFAIAVALLAILVYVKVKPIFETPEKPVLGEKWWKITKPAKVDTSIRPFKVQIPDEVITDLKYRLDHAIPLQKSLEGTAQHYGMNDKLLKTVVDFWRTKYDWREREKMLNQYPQFLTNIQGLDIHFVHVKPKQTQGLKVLPLMLLAGFPGSMREFFDVIPLLTTPRKGHDFVFELIIPSMPGYVFSEAPEKPGLNINEMSVIMKNLMDRLGFEKYYLSGGNWADVLVGSLATLFPEKVIGIHNTACSLNTLYSNVKLALGSLYPSLVDDEKYHHLIYPRSEALQFILLESGYWHIQATKPNTVGVGLRDSPVGLAAYILEKYTTWTNRAYKDLEDGGLTKKYKMEDLLDTVTLYWVSRSVMTAQRLYAETFSKEGMALMSLIESIPIDVPIACSRMENDFIFNAESLIRDKYKNLVQLTNHKAGGFSAMEIPQEFSDDIFKFVEIVENSLNVSKPKSS